ncbi:hypothetical protein [Phytohabitans houttuyneae]|uniref:hypothetical protein n=1 Tax=Phytohabitans houttuyneae TaxID=1076126 RepID=UPI0015678086|nr:hypothetical protein [Phytohabitans houttuyneae]
MIAGFVAVTVNRDTVQRAQVSKVLRDRPLANPQQIAWMTVLPHVLMIRAHIQMLQNRETGKVDFLQIRRISPPRSTRGPTGRSIQPLDCETVRQHLAKAVSLAPGPHRVTLRPARIL